ncbi:TIR domain-containing protein [Spirosoma oryzae]|uniref:TIR domain-containing protein n=1 Tax=Spirosoma oryzae TaxID=1469603 RepID=A0A2T0RGV2_9BACT|nr:toll/interleukin-1 receptor domain-containing protein [Spirosoma oryzae]PRY20395.1 TIR domain-containing protein [Spirosoma oryzae]
MKPESGNWTAHPSNDDNAINSCTEQVYKTRSWPLMLTFTVPKHRRCVMKQVESKKPVLFLSYCWENSTEAEVIYRDLTQIGLEVRKDNHNLVYKDSIDDFMQSIRNTDFAVILISDAYLKAKNCMHEIHHFLKEQEIKKKILPIILDGTKIYSAMDRLRYIQYWEEQENYLRKMLATVNPINSPQFISDTRIVRDISEQVDDFIKQLSNMLLINYSNMIEDKYLPLLRYIGFESKTDDNNGLPATVERSLQNSEQTPTNRTTHNLAELSLKPETSKYEYTHQTTMDDVIEYILIRLNTDFVGACLQVPDFCSTDGHDYDHRMEMRVRNKMYTHGVATPCDGVGQPETAIALTVKGMDVHDNGGWKRYLASQ